MNLLVFDIDGTIIDSVRIDDECYIQAFQDLYNIDLSNVVWNDFKNVTDSGITYEIFRHRLNRKPTEDDIEAVKSHYYKLINNKKREIQEIPGAISFINHACDRSDTKIAFATGGWRETAILKCQSIDFHVDQYILKTASNHFNRGKIIQLAIGESTIKNNDRHFDSITYIGDGPWDLAAAKSLNINFIGVDFSNNNKLREAGAKKIINDYSNIDFLLDGINTSTLI